MNYRWCECCGNPGPFNGNKCDTCGWVNENFVSNQKIAYKLWLDYQRLNKEVQDALIKLQEGVE